MARSQRFTVADSAPATQVTPRFTDPEQVLVYLNGTLNKDFQRIQELTAELDRFHQASAATANDLLGLVDHERTEATALREAQERGLEDLKRAVETAEDKSRTLDASIAEAKSTSDYITALGENVQVDHEARWVEAAQQLENQRVDLSQSLSDQIAAHIGELQGAHQAWRTQVESANQTWRKQVESANQAWQLAQAEQATQWRTSFEQEMEGRLDTYADEARSAVEQMAEHLDTTTSQARSASQQANENAGAIARVSQQQSESFQALQQQLEADHAAWETAIQSQASQNAEMRLSIAFLSKVMYGASAAIAVLTVLCIIALAH